MTGARRGPPGLVGADLARRAPPADWEAYLLIGLFPGAAADGLRWCKVQLFSGGRPGGGTCLAAVEEMDGPGQRLVLLGRAAGVERHEARFAPGELCAGELRAGAPGWHLVAPGLRWAGSLPRLTLEVDAPPLRAATASRDRLVWVRLGRVLSYVSAFGPLALESPAGVVRGLGLVEHAWGAQTRLPFRALVPSRWQWDVLAFDPEHGCAGLGVAAAGRWLPLRSGGSRPGGGLATGRGLRVTVDEWRGEAGRMVPVRWRGELALDGGVVRYQARATTPLAPVVTGGGFLGFDFAGEWRPRRGRAAPVAGAGFCEYRAPAA